MALTTILFDLDGTLLPMDQDVFVEAYFKHLAKAVAPYGYEPKALIKAIWKGTAAMLTNDGHASNEEVFWSSFAELFGERVQKDKPLFDAFYHSEFDNIRTVCGFDPAIPPLVRQLKEQNISLVLATNPIFPATATYHRIRWAGLNPSDFRFITSYENSRFCKPNPAYYQDILESLSLDAADCLMVGNDVGDDMPAAALGLRTFLLTDCLINRGNEDIQRYQHGDLAALKAYIEQLLAD